MTPSPIRKVLSTFRRHQVQSLLIGGQACILYGGAEFSRDIDFAVRPDRANLARLAKALAALEAEPVFLPPLSIEALLQGHACHFRCRQPQAAGLRVDIMSVMRGCPPFPKLWRRRRQVQTAGLGRVAVLSPLDLVNSKKTQRDKDWPMIARLVEADYRAAKRPRPARIRFWLLEARSEPLLLELIRRFPEHAAQLAVSRKAIQAARNGEVEAIRRALLAEQEQERRQDIAYWLPLRRQLEQWRHERHSVPPP